MKFKINFYYLAFNRFFVKQNKYVHMRSIGWGIGHKCGQIPNCCCHYWPQPLLLVLLLHLQMCVDFGHAFLTHKKGGTVRTVEMA